MSHADDWEIPQDAPRGGLAPWKLRKICALVDANLGEPLRNQQLADYVRLSAFHFAREFRRSTGISPRRYIIRRRVERAQQLMLWNDAPLSEIATECGLADQSHLSRIFVKTVGVPPRAWRRAQADRMQAPVMSTRLLEAPRS